MTPSTMSSRTNSATSGCSSAALMRATMRGPRTGSSHTSIKNVMTRVPTLVGTRVMTFFIEVWDDPVRGPRIVALMRAALEHPEVAEFVRELIVEGVIQPVATAVGAKDPARAAITAASQVFGLAMMRHAAHMEPLASEPAESLIARFGPILTRLLREDSP